VSKNPRLGRSIAALVVAALALSSARRAAAEVKIRKCRRV